MTERATAPMSAKGTPQTAAESVVEFHDVSLRYEAYGVRGEGATEDSDDYILKNLSFALPAGSFHFLVGASGAGKTSLMRMIYLAQKPSLGDISLFGARVRPHDRAQTAELRRRIGIVFQEFRLLDHLTTFENVALPLRVRGEPGSVYRSNVTELLEWVGLGERMDALPPLLSGGEKQRAAIARAVIGRPDILLADEPTGNVDPELSLRLVRLFAELNKLGTTIILATHELPLLDAFDFPHMSLKDGQVTLDG